MLYISPRGALLYPGRLPGEESWHKITGTWELEIEVTFRLLLLASGLIVVGASIGDKLLRVI
jgi:hypothetical protein